MCVFSGIWICICIPLVSLAHVNSNTNNFNRIFGSNTRQWGTTPLFGYCGSKAFINFTRVRVVVYLADVQYTQNQKTQSLINDVTQCQCHAKTPLFSRNIHIYQHNWCAINMYLRFIRCFTLKCVFIQLYFVYYAKWFLSRKLAVVY